MSAGEPRAVRVDRGGIAGAALVISLGNVTSRVLGLLRETVITHLFGATGAVSAFRAASSTYNLLYELLVGGIISSALVPILSEYAAADRREYRRLIGSLLLLLGLGTGVIVLLLELAAPWIGWVMAAGFGVELQNLTTDLIRLMLPAVILMALAGLLSAALYAAQEFAYPAFMAAAFNAAIIVAAVAAADVLHIRALALGVVLGSVCQLTLQAIGMRRRGARPLWTLYHPALKQLLLLSLPVLASLAVGQAQVVIDRNLASRTGDQSMAWMANATTLIQFPLGLVATAVSLAALPRLSRLGTTAEGSGGFLATLGFSLRLVLVLILPATFALYVLRTPLIRLLFEHGAFLPSDTTATAAALQLYVIGLPFAAIDQCLILAFYARRDTLRPALVGVAAVGIYLAVALLTISRLGMLGLVLANSAQWLGHALIMLLLSERRIGGLRGQRLPRTLVEALGASVLAAAVMAGLLAVLPTATFGGAMGEAMAVLLPGSAALVLYSALMLALRNEDFTAFARFSWSRTKAILAVVRR